MSHEFIHPNWHVVFMHYALGLLTVGVAIELLSFLWRRSTVRVAGRWMLLLGSLAGVPTLTTGMYAFRDVVSPEPIDDQDKWYNVVETSPWSDAQWALMDDHIWLAGSATILFLLATIVWLACSNYWRERLYFPTVIVVLLALALVSAAAWHGGESVYVHGTAVEAAAPPPPAHEPATQTSESQEPTTMPESTTHHYGDRRDEYSVNRPQQGLIEPYIPPLQLHLLLAGITIAVALGALGASFRRLTQDAFVPVRPPEPIVAPMSEPLEPGRAPLYARASVPVPPAMGIPVRLPARLWFVAALFGIGTVLAGVWYTDDWKLTALTVPLKDSFARQELQRLFGHVLFGSSIILLALLLAASTRFVPRSRFLTGFLSTLLILAVGGQIWLGILMLYDSNTGPLTGFNTP